MLGEDNLSIKGGVIAAGCESHTAKPNPPSVFENSKQRRGVASKMRKT